MRTLILAAAAVLAFTGAATAQGWPMAHGNSMQTSSTTMMGADKIRVAWTKDLGVVTEPDANRRPRSGMGVTMAPDGNLIVSASTAVYKLNANTGATMWTYAPGTAFRFSQALVDSSRVYVTSGGMITALNAASGAMVWQLPVDAGNPVNSTRIDNGSGGTVVSLSSPSAPIALLPGSTWFIVTSNDEGSTETAASAGILSVSSGGFVHTARHMLGKSVHSPAINRDGSIIIAKVMDTGSNQQQIYALNSDMTTLLWSTSSLAGQANWGIAMGTGTQANPTAFFTAVFDPPRLRAYNMASGADIWTSTFPMGGFLFSNNRGTRTPVYDSASDRVYFADETSLYAYDATNGQALWSTPVSNFNVFTPHWNIGTPLVAGTTTIYLTSEISVTGGAGLLRLANIDAANGSVRWSVSLGSMTAMSDFPYLDGAAYAPQVSPGNGAIFIQASAGTNPYYAQHSYVYRYEPAAYDTVTITTAAGGGATFYVSTASVRVTLGATAVSGVPVTVNTIAGNCPIFNSQTEDGYFLKSSATYHTDANGYINFLSTFSFSSVSNACFPGLVSTMTLTIPGLPAQTVYFRENRVSTFTISMSSPTIEINGQSVVRATTFTVTVKNGLGVGVPNVPVRVNLVNYLNNACNGDNTPDSLMTPGNQFGGTQLTDASGKAAFVHHTRFAVGSIMCGAGQDLPNVAPLADVYAVGVPPVLNVSLADLIPSTYTVSYTTPTIQSDVKQATMTVTVYDAAGSTVPSAFVLLQSLTSSVNFIYGSGSLLSGPTATCGGTSIYGVTDSFGAVRFLLDGTNCGANTFDNYGDGRSTASIFTPGIAVSTPSIGFESNFLASYLVSVPTVTSVGVAFQSTVTAVNAYGHRIPKYTESGVTLTPLFDQTSVQGTGSLGTSVISFAGSGGQVVISSQTYNKIENIQVKATRGSGSIKTGLSGTLLVNGPDHFIVTIPTGASAGTPFSMTIRAVDASSVQVVGYAGTISLSALNAGNLALAGAGVLGTTVVNMPANGQVTIANQTYTKAEAIAIRATDSGAALVGISTYSLTVGAGAPAQITLLANPQSSIAGVPSVLTATILDNFSNPVSKSTATFSVATGSGVVSLSLSGGSVVSAVTSTNAVTDAFGQATAFFSSTNSLSAQANVLRASIGALARDTTVYTTVLVTSAGGAVVNFASPQLRADVPANTYGFSVRLGIQSKAELSATDLAMTTAAFAATANTFVSTTVLKLSAVRDASPTVAAGAGSKFITVKMPYAVTSGSISVGAYGAQSILVPLSVMRVFKLNQTSSVFEQVLDGATTVDSLNGTISAEVADPDGVYVLGAPAFTNLTTGSSATVTTALSGGTSAQVIVPQGGFSSPATISVTVPGVSAVPSLPTRAGLTGTGITISVSAGGLQPTNPVTIKIGYRPIDVAGINPDYLRLARYDASTGWVVLDSNADSATRQVIGTTNHFSLFQIVAQAPGNSVADAFVFPNPFRPALGHTNIKLSNLPAAAHVKIYTSSGRLLKELDADAAGQVLTWNGTDRDGRALASGVYLAVIEGTGGRRTIKFAVQR